MGVKNEANPTLFFYLIRQLASQVHTTRPSESMSIGINMFLFHLGITGITAVWKNGSFLRHYCLPNAGLRTQYYSVGQ